MKIKFDSFKNKVVLFTGAVILQASCMAQKKPSKADAANKIKYEADQASLSQHQLPDWYQDAKLGIFIHWGLYSVPGWAKGTSKPLETILKESSGEEWFANNPYAEWYLNSLKIKGSSTEKHHQQTYGANFSYYDFVPQFNDEISKWNPNEMAALFKSVGAKYVVLTTKHHDGFLLWPSKYPNPFRENYFARRDLVGELTNAVRKNGMEMGLYYSSGLDWTFNTKTISNFPDLFQAVPQDKEYVKYIDQHWNELIDRYKPSVLWADIGSPKEYDPTPMMARYYNTIPSGVVNDRHKFSLTPTGFGTTIHHDITTPEYRVLDSINEKKWETCRGIGLSFGYNQNEDVNEFLSVNDLIDSFIDIVSKNGNLLLNVGPKADGSIQEGQLVRLKGLGAWLSKNGEAIYGTRYWKQSSASTSDGGRVRFTQKNGNLYILLLDEPRNSQVTIKDLAIPANKKMQLLQSRQQLNYQQQGNDLVIQLPPSVATSEAYAIKVY